MFSRTTVIILASLALAAGLLLTTSFPAAADDLLKAGDQVGLNVTGEEELTHVFTVDDTGAIELSSAFGKVQVAGKTAEQAALAIRTHLSKYIKEPDVTVQMVKSKGTKITIQGDVKSPGPYEITQQIGVRDCLAFAGGALETADLSDVTIVRGGQIIKADLNKIRAAADPSKDVLLQDGDTVIVASRIAGKFTILGAVKSVGTYPLLTGTRVLDAVRIAGGPEDAARVMKVKITHDDGSVEESDLNKLLYEGVVAENKLVLPGDTVVVEADQGSPGSFSVMGAVYKPGPYPLTKKMTVTEAIALTGGPTPNALSDKCELLRRGKDGKYEVTPINFKDITKTSEQLVMHIQDGDVLNVPERGKQKRGLLEMLPYLGPLFYLF
jgi:polysaccharide export outer membrane protein